MAGGLIAVDSGLLPPLRADINFAKQTVGHDGVGHWQLHDPVQHRFFRVDDDTKRILSIWRLGITFEELATEARSEFGIDLTYSVFQQLVRFLEASNLFSHPEDGAWKPLRQKSGTGKLKYGQILGQLISVKLPLANPEPLLRLLGPFTAPIFTVKFTLLMSVLTLAGLFLSASDMLALLSTHFANINVHGLIVVALALAVLKTCHELGHALTAFRFGCRVPTFGIAFMVFMPLLYTDVSDSWRLKSKNKRLLISAAGVMVEVYLAAIATLLWAFLGDGFAKDIAFYIATVGWISSLAFNLNPLAKFDGYYILSDALGIENLQSRAAEIALWKLRQLLILPDLGQPKDYSRKKCAMLIAFAVLSWIYRLGIFAGIALVFYNFTAKILGVILLNLTLFQFVLLPVWKEIQVWRSLISHHRTSVRPRRLAVVLIFLAAGLALPLFGQVYAPAILVDSDLQRVFPPEDAKIKAVHIGESDNVKKGDPLVDFEIPQLQSDIKKNGIELEAAKRQLARALSSQTDRTTIALLRQDIETLERRGMGIATQVRELSIVSRLDGRVVQVSRELQPGNWVSRDRWIALVGSGRVHVMRGYLREEDLDRISIDTLGTFIPDDPSRESIPLAVSRISNDAAQQLELPELSSQSGGSIETYSERGKQMMPIGPMFPVEFRLIGKQPSANQIIRGTAVLNGRRESLATIFWRRITKVFIKESVM